MTTPIISYPWRGWFWLPSFQKASPGQASPLPHSRQDPFLDERRKGRKDNKLRLPGTQNLIFPLPLSKYLQYSASLLKKDGGRVNSEFCGDSSAKGWRDGETGLTSPVLGSKLWQVSPIWKPGTRRLSCHVLMCNESEVCRKHPNLTSLFSPPKSTPSQSLPRHHQCCVSLAWDSDLLHQLIYSYANHAPTCCPQGHCSLTYPFKVFKCSMEETQSRLTYFIILEEPIKNGYYVS